MAALEGTFTHYDGSKVGSNQAEQQIFFQPTTLTLTLTLTLNPNPYHDQMY